MPPAPASTSEAKLTKAQRKALQFKQRKSKHEPDGGDLPQADPVPAEERSEPKLETVKDTKGKEKGKPTPIAPPEEGTSKKRKRGAGEAKAEDAGAPAAKKDKGKSKADPGSQAAQDQSAPAKGKSKAAPDSQAAQDQAALAKGKATKTKKVFDEEGNEVEVAVEEESAKGSKEDKEKASRFILFVGNMSFKTTAETLTKHFADHCGESPSVRLLTTKGDSGKAASALPKSKQKSIAKGKAQDPGAARSKGCAFVEFATSSALRKALTFHHTQLEGRQINVELTAGGGGNTAGRKDKIKKKNDKLEEERRKLHEKYVKPGEEKRKAAGKEKREGAAAEGQGEKKGWGKMGKDGRTPSKVPRWMATGANATRLQG